MYIILLEQLIFVQLANKLPPVMAPRTSSPCLIKTAVGYCAEIIHGRSYFHSLFP